MPTEVPIPSQASAPASAPSPHHVVPTHPFLVLSLRCCHLFIPTTIPPRTMHNLETCVFHASSKISDFLNVSLKSAGF